MMKDALNSLPATLENAYQRIIDRIGEKGEDTLQLAWRILSWVFHAARPLRMYEIREAISVRLGDNELDEQDFLHPDDIVEVCESLLVYDESSEIVRFTHYSVQEFLSNNCTQELQSCVLLANTCIAYLGFDAFDEYCRKAKTLEKWVQNYKFGSYAAEFWGFHTRGEAEKLPHVQRTVLSLLASDTKRNSMLQLKYHSRYDWGSISFDGITILHIISEEGLVTICRLILGRDGGHGSDRYVLFISTRC
jgi:hypothetical protein